MTYTIKLNGRKVIPNSQILTMVLIGLVVVMLQSSTVYAQWTTTGSNISNTNAGNVGIGTPGPAEIVHVRKDQNAATRVLVENATAGNAAYSDFQVKNNLGHFAQFGLYSSTTTTAGAIASGNAFTYTTSPAMVIMANNSSGVIKFATGGLGERVRIDASGNVGIGVTAPANRLVVTGDGSGIEQFGSSGCGYNYVAITLSLTTAPSGCTNYTFTSSPDDQNLYINRPSGKAIKFRENNNPTAEQLVIASGGNVRLPVAGTTPTWETSLIWTF